MTNKTIFFLIASILWTKIFFPQDEIRVDILPTNKSAHIAILIPYGQTFIREHYNNVKFNYWSGSFDTLKLDHGIYQTNGAVINLDAYKIKLNKCDTSINRIRNGALVQLALLDLRALTPKEIGYDNKEFNSNIEKERPNLYKKANMCNDDFKPFIKHWFDMQVEKMNAIKKAKLDRQQWILSNPDKIDQHFIKLFLQDFSSCNIDQNVMLWIIANKTDNFLSVCKDLDGSDFFNVKLKLSDLPKNMAILEAIEKLNTSSIKTSRKRKIIKVLNKANRNVI